MNLLQGYLQFSFQFCFDFTSFELRFIETTFSPQKGRGNVCVHPSFPTPHMWDYIGFIVVVVLINIWIACRQGVYTTYTRCGIKSQEAKGDSATLVHNWGCGICAAATETLQAAREGARLSVDPKYIPPHDYHHCAMESLLVQDVHGGKRLSNSSSQSLRLVFSLLLTKCFCFLMFLLNIILISWFKWF